MSWFAIFQLGLIQAALGSVVVLTTSTLNRVMVVELALPALVPGLVGRAHPHAHRGARYRANPSQQSPGGRS